MKFQKSITLTLVLISTLVMAQKKELVVIQEYLHADSLEHNITIQADHDLFNSTTHKVINIHSSFDSLGSEMKNIFIQRAPGHEQKTARVIIKKSGFFRKNKIIIDFNPLGLQIIRVVDNGEDVPEKKFHKYQEYLEDATDLADLEALHPRMDELEMIIELKDFPDSQKIADLEAIIIDLESLESDRALMKKEHFFSIKRIVELEELSKEILEILEEGGLTPPQKITEIEVTDDQFFLNGNEITGELGKKCIEAYASHSNIEIEGDSHKTKWIEKHNSTHIKFD